MVEKKANHENPPMAEISPKDKYGIGNYIAEQVAELCGISTDEMFSSSNARHTAHARWLYWYAYQYMTKDDYGTISRFSPNNGRVFSRSSISYGVSCMSMMVEREYAWKGRWKTIKHAIKTIRGDDEEEIDRTIVIRVPKDLKKKINIEIKEK